MIQLHYSGIVLEITPEIINSKEDNIVLSMKKLLLSTELNPFFEFFDNFYTRNLFFYTLDSISFSYELLLKPEFYYSQPYINSVLDSIPLERDDYRHTTYINIYEALLDRD